MSLDLSSKPSFGFMNSFFETDFQLKAHELSQLLQESLAQGHLALDYSLEKNPSLNELVELLKPTMNQKESVFFATNTHVCFKNIWLLQQSICQELNRLIHRVNPKACPEVAENLVLNERQKQALHSFHQMSLLVLTGGPGTGKSYTAASIIEQFFTLNPKAKIVVTAPTGKAANQLLSYLQAKKIDNVEAKTLHRLLKIAPNSSKTTFDHFNPLPFDLVVLDEASMVDIGMWLKLLSAVGGKTKLVLIGDPKQLPPIEAGGVFSDIIDVLDQFFPNQHVHLEQSLRAQNQSLQQLAKAVEHQSIDDFDILFGQEPFKWYQEIQTKQQFDELLFDLLKENVFQSCCDLESAILQLKKSCILTPLKKGPFGSEQINEKILMKFSEIKAPFYIPIINRSNQSELSISNGQLGILKISQLLPKYAFQNTARFFHAVVKANEKVYFSEKEANIPFCLLHHVELAWSISIHKSQGSEFDVVWMVLPEGSEVFGKEVVYTGFTRAKKGLSLFATKDQLKKTIENNLKRQSMILDIFREKKEP